MKRNFESDYIKAAKRAAREEFGLQPTRISSNERKYSRSREKRQLRDIKLQYGY